MENYSLKETDGYTELTVDLDTDKEYLDYFNKTFPKALDKVRELSEKLNCSFKVLFMNKYAYNSSYLQI